MSEEEEQKKTQKNLEQGIPLNGPRYTRSLTTTCRGKFCFFLLQDGERVMEQEEEEILGDASDGVTGLSGGCFPNG